MPKDPRTLRSLRSGASMPDQSSRASALAGIVATQARHASGGSIRFPDHASRIRYMQGVIYAQQRQTLEPPAPTVPNAPTAVMASRGNQQVPVSFTAPADNGGSPIIDYTVISSPGDISAISTSSPIIVAGLTNGTAYTFRVKARNAIGYSPLSTPSAAVIPATTPDSPTNIAGARGDSAITVSFTPPADNGGALILDYTATAYDGITLASSQITSASPVELSGLTNGTPYTVKVKARNEIGFSTEAAAPTSITPATVPQPPTLQSTTSGDSSISISFSTGDNGGSPITNYQYSIDAGSTFTAFSPAQTSSPANITGLTNGVQYVVSLKAVNDVGPSAGSDSAIVMPVTTPSAPTGLVATAGDSSVSITFTAGANGGSAITNYKYSLNGGVYTAVSPADAVSPVVISGLSNGTPYTIRLKAVNSVGDGAASEPISATPVSPIRAPDAPTNLVAYTVGISSVIISFTDPSDGGSVITNYQYSINNGVSYTSFNPVETFSPVTITGLSASTSYQIKLKAVNAIGASVASSALSITTNTGPTAPTLTYALPDDDAAYIYFDAGTNGGSTITNYEYSVDGGAFTSVNPVDTNSPIKLSGLSNGTTYAIRLRSVTGVGNSDASNVLSVTPAANVARTASLDYDPSNTVSYPGTGTTLNNIGSAGTMSGTLRGSVTYDSTIKGGILDFTGANGTYITFPSYNFGNQMTVCAWVYPRTKNDIAGLLSNAGANVATNGIKFQWNWWLNSSQTIGIQAGNGSSGGDYYSPQNTLTYDTWQHLTYVFDKANAKILVFLNGTPTTMATSVNTVANINTNAAFNIGGYASGYYTMNAQLGSIKVYSGLMTAADVQAEFNATKQRFSVPDSPKITNAYIEGATNTLTIIFTPPTNTGNAPINNYEYSIDNSAYIACVPSIQNSPIVINNIYNANLVSIRAVNSFGTGFASRLASVAIIPIPI